MILQVYVKELSIEIIGEYKLSLHDRINYCLKCDGVYLLSENYLYTHLVNTDLINKFKDHKDGNHLYEGVTSYMRDIELNKLIK